MKKLTTDSMSIYSFKLPVEGVVITAVSMAEKSFFHVSKYSSAVSPRAGAISVRSGSAIITGRVPWLLFPF